MAKNPQHPIQPGPDLPRGTEDPPLDAKTREYLEQHERALADELRQNPVEEEWVGRTPEEQKAFEAAVERRVSALLDRLTSATERRMQSLEDQLRENVQITQKIARDRGLGAVTAEVVAMQAERERRFGYERIRANGDAALITIHTHEDPGRNGPVPVCVNGQAWSIRRGVPTRVPAAVVEVLDHARRDQVVRIVGADGNPRFESQTLMEFPYTLIDVGIGGSIQGLEKIRATA